MGGNMVIPVINRQWISYRRFKSYFS